MSDNIWTVKSESIFDGKPETSRQFQYFQQYLMQYGRRSVRRLHEDLEKSNKKSNKKSNIKIPKYETLRNYCHKFNWVKRVEAYDEYQITLNFRKKELQLSKLYSDVADFSLKELDSSIGLVDYPKTVLHDVLELYENDKISLDEFNKCVGSAIKNYRNAVELVHGYDPTRGKNKATVNNLNQFSSENYITFRDLFEEKGAVIDEILEDEER